MSNPQFVRILSSHEYDTFTFPKHILYDDKLSGNAIKLLLVMLDYGKRPNWKLMQTHLIAISNMGYRMYDSSIKVLIEAGYVRRHREKIKGKWSAYQYQFSAFPIFLDEAYQSPPEKPFEPVAVLQTGSCSLENVNFTYSNIDNVLEETTKPPSPKNSKKNSLVSSSFEKIQQLEQLPNISESQKTTLYKKFSKDQILEAIKCLDVEGAESVFAVLYSAIIEGWKPNLPKEERFKENIALVKQADMYLSSLGSCNICVSVDDKNAYIHLGTAMSKYPLSDPDFREKFLKAVNNRK